MLFYCSEHMQKRESNICELDTCSFLRFSLPTNTEPETGPVDLTMKSLLTDFILIEMDLFPLNL